jgi:prevent-host-death family protein
MKKVGVREAKLHFSRLLDEVRRGQSFWITRRGRPVAMLVPVAGPHTLSVTNAIAGLRQFRAGRRLGEVSLRELISDGRR